MVSSHRAAGAVFDEVILERIARRDAGPDTKS
jgi:hypothetical protein